MNGPLRTVANYTIVPMQKGINHIGLWMSDLTKNFETLTEVKNENEELQKTVDELTIENNRLQQERYELERLQELYALDQNYADYKKVGAHAVSYTHLDVYKRQRPSFSVAQIGQLIAFVKKIKPDVICMVDNCYGEFVETIEPSDVGADLIVGSLIKNPGGGLAPIGGYIAGKEEYIETVSYTHLLLPVPQKVYICPDI